MSYCLASCAIHNSDAVIDLLHDIQFDKLALLLGHAFLIAEMAKMHYMSFDK